MQFLLIAYDGTDPGAHDRRMGARKEHLEKTELLKRRGECIAGGAILDNEGKMIGSMIVYDFTDRNALDGHLKQEPYLINGVWQKVEIQPFRMAITSK